ncbi:response regulator [Epibacterium sp. SM1969]|uniref:Sensory/regulatory protein RpfC n=1 Tax=Tritonibacter aquimaris TaxID=2663379 RepID=A0A844AVN3_9RHOB|nr:ATP-binding protein [Tritonibacter aquimaris]MQY42051.1 response regulator [Tritonibacter aquimaris]
MSETCPVNEHERRYSKEGLLKRYAQHKTDHFRGRLLFSAGWCAIVALLLSPEVAAVCFVLVALGDWVDSWYLRGLARAQPEEIDLRKATRWSVLTGVFDIALFATAAGLPTYLCELELNWHTLHWEPIFSIYVLISFAMVQIMFLPLHPIAVISRVVILFAVPTVILAIGSSNAHLASDPHFLNVGGILVVITTAIWTGRLVNARHSRRRRTELKQAKQQRELQSAYAQMFAQQVEARRLALVAESANDSVMIMDRARRISWVNESFTRMTGYRASEAIGRRPRDLLASDNTDSAVLAQLNRKAARGESARVVLHNRRKDGSPIWIETSQVPMMNSRGELETLIAIERDITAAKEHEKELEAARVAAEEGARSKAEFLATMSHEIRTPLNGVIGMAQLLEQTALDEEQQKFTDTIHSSARSLLALINDVLDMSKMEAKEITLSPVSFSVRQCFEETLRLLEPLAREKGIDLELHIAPDTPEHLFGDDRRITQILMNILGNAVKFTDQGKVTVQVSCPTQTTEPRLQFSVQDTGIGIAPEMLDRVFERFSQADAAISRRFGGTGLGLTISQKLAHAMQGEISVSSTLGEGSCFTVQLQVQAAHSAPIEVDLASDDEVDLTGTRVLVAEDNQVNRMLVQKFLKNTGAEIEFAFDGREAIEKAKSISPHIIVMDLSMPHVNGLDATRAIRQLPIEQPYIVALTANAFDEDKKACLSAGMDDFLSKPVNRKTLLSRLQNVVSEINGRRNLLYDGTAPRLDSGKTTG